MYSKIIGIGEVAAVQMAKQELGGGEVKMGGNTREGQAPISSN